MSYLDSFTEGWHFRTNRPSFDEGDEISAFVTGVEGDSPIARIGDTKLRITGASPEILDKRVLLRVTAFDDDEHSGEAEYLQTVGESAF